MASYQIMYWKHIPAQIKVFAEGKVVSREMPKRFQNLIDQVAMAEGLIGSDAYLDQFYWGEKRERPGSAEEVLNQVIFELESQFNLTVESHPGRSVNVSGSDES
jgi:hypothetical protein